MDSTLKTGKLNRQVGLTCAVSLADGSVPPLENAGDPVKGETLTVKWSHFWDEGLRIDLRFKKCYVSSVELQLGETVKLRGISLYAGDALLSAHEAETGETFQKSAVCLRADRVADSLTLCFDTWYDDVEIAEIALWGATLADCPIYPVPDSYKEGEGRFRFNRIRAAKGFENARDVLAEKYAEITGVSLTEGEGGIALIEEPGHRNNGWRICVRAEGAALYASDERGAVMAAEAFIALCGADGAREAEAALEPALPFRGIHIYPPAMKWMEFAKNWIKYMISPSGYNRVIVCVTAGMLFQSHPEINEAVQRAIRAHRDGTAPDFPFGDVAEGEPLTHEEMKDFIAYLRKYGLDVIPEIQSLGHVQYLTVAHPEIAEVEEQTGTEKADVRQEDQRPEKYYRHSYCPSKEESYRLLFDVADEIIDVFEPREYVHMGHDEVYEIGVCPICSKKDPARLFADDVNRLHDYLKKKGLKMIIWSDMIQPVTKYQTPRAIDMIPKDILMMDFIWYFHFDKDLEDNLLEKGFTVTIGNLYSSHYPRYTARAYKKGMIGGEISTWAPTELHWLESEGKLYDIMMTAQMLCGQYDSRLKDYYDRQITARTPAMREKLTGVAYPSLRRAAHTVWERKGDPAAPEYEAPGTLEVGAAAESLIFTQALLRRVTKKPWVPGAEMGRWEIAFTDGTSLSHPVFADKNVGWFYRRAHDPIPHKVFRHNGYITSFFCDPVNLTGPDGSPRCWYRDEVVLPHGKTVRSVRFAPAEKDGLLVLEKLEYVE